MLQLELFAQLPIPPDARLRKRRGFVRRVITVDRFTEQLAFVFRLRALECDRDTEFDYPQRMIVAASGSIAPITAAPRSVFELARNVQGDLLGGLHTPARVGPSEVRTVAKVHVRDGVTRHVGAAYPSRWTAEDEERERQRRARQRPPRPPKKARTMSKKLTDMIMGDDDGQ